MCVTTTSETMKITIIAGARPNFMKIAPMMDAFGEARGGGADVEVRLVHTGQHYDRKMSETFFRELGIPEPDVNLGVGSGSHIHQLAEVMKALEAEFSEHRPDLVIVVGDVNSPAAAAITANKMRIQVAHVEAGLRSFDRDMPEEINRLLTDSIADWLYTSEPSGRENLLREGVAEDRIVFVGNVMIDTQRKHLPRAAACDVLDRLGLKESEYVLLTLHRPSNVDDREHFESILRAIHDVNERFPVIFPMHPRTRSRIEAFGFASRNDLNGFRAVDPVGYIEMLALMQSARLVLTDSGGVQEETTAIQVPCLTLRENTERPVTVDVGSNRLVGWRTENILSAVADVLSKPKRFGEVPEKWDGCAAKRIVEHVLKFEV